VNNILISEGYAPIISKNIKINYDLLKEYENKAQKINCNYDLSYENREIKVNQLLVEFLQKLKSL